MEITAMNILEPKKDISPQLREERFFLSRINANKPKCTQDIF